MIETIQTVAELTPIAAIIILAGVAATVLTQLAKRPGWTAARSQAAALAVSIVLGLVAYVVSGVATVFPDSLVEVVSTAVVVIAGVALMSHAAYGLLGRAVPDGRETISAEQRTDGVYTVVNPRGLSADEVSEETARQQKRRQDLAGEGHDDADAWLAEGMSWQCHGCTATYPSEWARDQREHDEDDRDARRR